MSDHPTAERNAYMESQYREGRTLASIAAEFHITRERVRQILRRRGVSVNDGGIAVRKVKRIGAIKQGQADRKAAHIARHYMTDPVSYATAIGYLGHHARHIRTSYLKLKLRCERQRIPFKLTFPQFVDLIGFRATEYGSTVIIRAKRLRFGYVPGNVEVTDRLGGQSKPAAPRRKGKHRRAKRR